MKMSIITVIGILVAVFGFLQILIPDKILHLRPLGVKSVEAVKYGGYLTVVVGLGMVLFDLLILK